MRAYIANVITGRASNRTPTPPERICRRASSGQSTREPDVWLTIEQYLDANLAVDA